MKKTIATIILVSVAGVVSYFNIDITDVSQIPKTPIVGVIITKEAGVKNVKDILNYIKENNQAVYVASDKGVSPEIRKELKKHSEIKSGYWVTDTSIEHLKFLIESSAPDKDFAIIKI